MAEPLTHHARYRCAQRSISAEILEALLSYGIEKRRRGASIYFLDKRSREQLLASLPRSARLKIERKLHAYAVVGDDGAVVTAAFRKERLRF